MLHIASNNSSTANQDGCEPPQPSYAVFPKLQRLLPRPSEAAVAGLLSVAWGKMWYKMWYIDEALHEKNKQKQ